MLIITRRPPDLCSASSGGLLSAGLLSLSPPPATRAGHGKRRTYGEP